MSKYSKNKFRFFYISLIFFLFIILVFPGLYAQDPEEEELGKDFDYFFGIEEQIDFDVDVASLFLEDELVVGSTVSRITPYMWKMLGAKRTHEALNNEMSVMSYPVLIGAYAIAIRGYTTTESVSGIATLLDGVPINGLQLGTAFYSVPNWELNTLNSIEIIKGPGSAIYGTDAFHGVISMKTFESEDDVYALEAAGANPNYSEANLQISHGLFDNILKINASAASSQQGDQDIDYMYDDHGTTGKGKWKNEFNSQSGVLKLSVKPVNKLKFDMGAYVYHFACEDFPGTYMIPAYLRSNDLSSQDSLFFMGKGSASYEFKNKVALSAGGYHWQVDGRSDIVIDPDGRYSSITGVSGRTGADLIIKQPGNPLNIQWLFSYSYSRLTISNNYTKILDSNDDLVIDLGVNPYQGFTRHIHSILGQVKYGVLNDSIFFLAGGRLDYYSDFGSQFSPRGGVIFFPALESSVKILYGRAFKAPNASQKYGTSILIRGDKDLKPEIIDVCEIIFIHKTDSWKLNISGFYSYWKNGIIGILDPNESTNVKYVNQGKNQAFGGELELFFSFNPFAANLGFAYVKSKRFNAEQSNNYGDPITNPDGSFKTADKEFLAFPEYSVNAGLYYTLDFLDLNIFLNNRIYLNMTIFKREFMPPYYRTDLNFSKNVFDNLDLFLDLRNLFNRRNYIPSLFGGAKGHEEPGFSAMLRAGYKV